MNIGNSNGKLQIEVYGFELPKEIYIHKHKIENIRSFPDGLEVLTKHEFVPRETIALGGTSEFDNPQYKSPTPANSYHLKVIDESRKRILEYSIQCPIPSAEA